MDATPASVAPAQHTIHYRPAEVGDFEFIQATLLNHYNEESFWARRLTTRVFFDGHTPLVRTLLQRVRGVVACDSLDPTLIFGFVLFEPKGGPDETDVLDFLYVKKAWRRLGLGQRLLRETGLPPDLAGVHVTFCTEAWFRTKNHSGLEERFKATYWPYGQWRAFTL
jgi:GNAT superfamily N-acetyltransferase